METAFINSVQRALPIMSCDGDEYMRLTDTPELTELNHIFAPGQQLLRQLIAEHHLLPND